MDSVIYNPNPTVFLSSQPTRSSSKIPLWMEEDDDETVNFEDDSNDVEPIDQNEIFDLVRSINDPEHPNTLEQLRVVSAPQITIKGNLVTVEFTPTVPHCGMSTLIGLSLRVRLLRSLPTRFKVDIFVKPGSHNSEHAVNKQLNDKERVAAALENPHIVKAVEDCLESAGRRGQ